MGQLWRLYNLEKQSYIDFSDGSFKLPEWFFSDDPTRLLIKLRPNGVSDSWAGDRMICFGCYAYSVPEGVMSEVEIADLKAKRKAVLKAKTKAKEVEEEEGEGSDYQEIQHILDDIGLKDYVPEPENFDYSTYVVRNLSKKMYIRGDNTPGPVSCLFPIHDAFGQMLFANVCWSDDPSSNMAGSDMLIRGEWAGDRFDVVDIEAVKDELSKDEWVDCTEKMKKRVEHVYRGKLHLLVIDSSNNKKCTGVR